MAFMIYKKGKVLEKVKNFWFRYYHPGLKLGKKDILQILIKQINWEPSYFIGDICPTIQLSKEDFRSCFFYQTEVWSFLSNSVIN